MLSIFFTQKHLVYIVEPFFTCFLSDHSCTLGRISKVLPIHFLYLAWSGSYLLILINSFTILLCSVCTFLSGHVLFHSVIVSLAVLTHSTMLRVFQPVGSFQNSGSPRSSGAIDHHHGHYWHHHQVVLPPSIHFTSLILPPSHGDLSTNSETSLAFYFMVHLHCL